jgi:hypothetical protein
MQFPVAEQSWSRIWPIGPFGASKGTSLVIGDGGNSTTLGFLPGLEIVALFAGGYNVSESSTSKAALVFGDGRLREGLHMLAARNEHAMSPIAGGRVLITGGFGQRTPVNTLRSAELFVYAIQDFVWTDSMRTARAEHALSTLLDGRVLVSGGLAVDADGVPLGASATTEIFDPASGTFSDGPAMNVARYNHSSITLPDGRVLVLGGDGTRTAELFSPVSNTFSAPIEMSVNRGVGHSAVRLLNGMVLIVGGDAGGGQPTAVAEIFDPATNTFSPVANMNEARMRHFAVLMNNGKVMVGGGRGATGADLLSVEIYDPAANSWTPAENLRQGVVDSPAAYVRPPG